MPELPEVETVRRGLEERIVGLRICEVEVLCEKSFIGDATDVVGRTVERLRRFGKALIIDLSGGMSMMIHLRMTGQLIFDGEGKFAAGDSAEGKFSAKRSATEVAGRFAAGHPSENFMAKLPNKQTRVVFRFESDSEEDFGGKEARSELRETGVGTKTKAGVDDGEETGVGMRMRAGTLYFNDQRKFGFVKVLATAEVEKEPFVMKLAKEPWEMTAGEFFEALERHKQSAIKAVILDQSVIAGLGNIYADEALFRAKIHPERKAGSLSESEAKRLLLAAREVMMRSIESGGSTMATYVKADGTRGDYLEKFAQVFRKEGQPCPRCGAEIVKIRVAGRGTHICPKCQKKEGK